MLMMKLKWCTMLSVDDGLTVVCCNVFVYTLLCSVNIYFYSCECNFGYTGYTSLLLATLVLATDVSLFYVH